MIPRAILRLAVRLRRSPPRIFALCTACVCVIGIVDLATPFEFILSVLYLPPILIAVGSCGRRAGVLLSLLATAFWMWDGLSIHVPAGMPPWLILWQVCERLTLYLVLIFLIDAMLARAKRGGRLLAQERRGSKTKSDALSLVSHELNNSMTMIGLAVRELEEGGKHAASREEIFGIVKRNVSRMGILAQNFLSEARLASGQSKLTLAPEPLEEIVAGVVASVRPLSDDKGIAVSWSVVPSDLRASVDRVALGVALTNLVGNAIKYTPEGGRVSVDVRLREGPPRRASVCVEDNGIGISAEDQARVLSAFERTESGRRTASGYGLGLKLAHDIIKAHGGALAIDSRPGKGSKFSFLLQA